MNILIKTKKPMRNTGYSVLLVVVFSAIFLSVFMGLANLLLLQGKTQQDKEHQESAVQIAEAGLDYYGWFLSHYPTDLQDKTGQPGPYVHDYKDGSGNPIGKFSLQIAGNYACGKVSSVIINSTGWTNDNPTLKKTITGRYSQPNVATYAYILDSSVWVGSDRQINGPYYSNGGIRMDGTNNSSVNSKLSTWNCTPSFGCASPSETKPGIFGSGSGSALWSFPAAWISFSNINSSFPDLRTTAKASGLYFGLSTTGNGNSTNKGWHFVFNSDGTVSVSRVKTVDTIWGNPTGAPADWAQESTILDTETPSVVYTLPNGCGVIFVEDDVWIEGTVKGKISLIAANIDLGSTNRSIVIHGNINYTTNNGTDGLMALAQKNVLVPLNSPDVLSVNGIFIAQGGYFGRNYYFYSHGDSHSVPPQYKNYVLRTQMNILGTVVSSGRVGTKWTSSGVWVSGYGTRIDSYDKKQMDNPPPLTPATSPDYKFVLWGSN